MRSVPGTDALHRCTVIIPALDEAGAIAGVVRGVPAGLHADVLVVDNGSRDGTADAAAAAGARVVREPRRGYGRACHTGVAASPDATVVVFIDGDGSMPPEEIGALVAPIVEGRADLVCGSRTARREVRLTDLGPYRAVRGELLRELGMRPSRFAWPAEMLARAARRRARIVEVEVGYRRRRAGASKVGGSLRGSLGAGLGIVGALLWHRVAPR
jgi:glycosyltransferase involved in cell wall biosynthesis